MYPIALACSNKNSYSVWIDKVFIFKSSSGLHLALSREELIFKAFVYYVSLAYKQFKNVSALQNISFSFQVVILDPIVDINAALRLP